MALQDLTPQLRTRLSRMERAVGWFVLLAALLLAFGFAYYVYNTAERKGWFKVKAPYFTFTDSASGLKVGDPVMLMGLNVGQITRMEPMAPEDQYNMYVEFEIKEPYYGYLWTEGSSARVATADFLGKRVLEVTKGTSGYQTYIFHPLRQVSLAEAQSLPDLTNWAFAQELVFQETNFLGKPFWRLTNLPALETAGLTNFRIMDTNQTRKIMTGVWNDKNHLYDFYDKSKPYWLVSDEAPAISERLEKLVRAVETALPNILRLTNQLASVLSNGATLTSNLNLVALNARPAVSNLALVTSQLDHPGAIGEWLLPTNLQKQLAGTLGSADATLTSANTNLTALVENLGRSLDNLASMTSNLNSQVEANTNILTEISGTIVHADEFVQGLKRHWLLRSAFRTKSTNAPPVEPSRPIRTPKGQELR
jgi:ABC-type transporter Mla subunit MlaD